MSQVKRMSVVLLACVGVLAIASCSKPPAQRGGAGGSSATDTAPPSAFSAAAPGASVESSSEAIPAASTASEGLPEEGDWLITRLPVEPAHLNPLLDTGDAYTARMTQRLFESLLTRNNATLEFEPMLAESYEISDDKLTYTFHLRKDARFSDGAPVTSADVVFTYEAIQNPKNETADIRNYYQDVVSVESPDEYTVAFHCAKPYFKHLEMLGGLPVFPKHIYSQGDFNKGPNNRLPVGSGPYVFQEWTTNQQIVFTRNAGYWNKAKMPHLDKLVFKIITDDNAAFQVLQRQELGIMSLTPEQWINQADTPDFKVKFDKYKAWGSAGYVGGYSFIAWNLRKPQFQDKMVRRALTMLLNRQLILDTIYYSLGKVVSGGAWSESSEYDKSIEPWPFEPESAKKLLDEAGWTDSNHDGIRDKDGIPFTFEFMMASGNREVEQMATVFKEELERAGINMTIRQLEWATFIENLTQRKFDAITLSWAIPLDQDPYQVWHSSQAEKGSNYPGFANAEVDKILEEARVTFDREQRNALYRRWHQILHEEQPYTFLFNRYNLSAVDKRYKNVRLYPQGFDDTEWWVPKNLQRYK